ncbi:MAG: hypothetical protein HY784_06380 [Chloroflexi bacterium]|nr:hypothetical protein [Chloroflexota bacterium]
MSASLQGFAQLAAGTLAALTLMAAAAPVLSRAAAWRVQLGALAAQYLLGALLIAAWLPLPAVIARILTGGVVCSLLGFSEGRLGRPAARADAALSAGRLFRGFAAALVAIVALALAARPLSLAPEVSPAAAFAAFALIGLGLLNLGLGGEAAFPSAIGLLSALGGFEILYTARESSRAVIGLLAGVHVTLTLSINYLALATPPDHEPHPPDEEGRAP